MTILVFATALALAAPAESLQTTAERTKWERTGRYAEAVELCHAYAKAFSAKVRCIELGKTPEGRPMVALVASADGVLDAAAAREKKRPVVLFQGGIHAGEIDGKDAGFEALRMLLADEHGKGHLAKVTAVFVPVFNPDGHERFGANNRPNQVGPKEMGWRTNAQNLNLNRDYAKADSPEMQAMLRLLGEWEPIVYVDLHVTDGAKFRHAIAYLVEPILAGPEELRPLARDLREDVRKRLDRAGHLPVVEFYPSFEVDDDPTSGFAAYVAPPRFSTAYWAARNRIGVLVETHSWKDYATRVRATRDAVLATIESVAKRGPAMLEAAAKAEASARRLGGTTFALVSDATPKTRTIDFLGYAYETKPSAISGAPRIVYDEKKPQVWKVPFRDDVVPVVTAALPRGGYVVPPVHAAWVRERLRVHGIEFREAAPGAREVEVFRATKTGFGAAPYEGRQTLKVEGAWTRERQEIPAGSLFVPIAQKNARLVAHLFEPAAPDSFLAWGFFNAHFERKEYMEAYVAEEVAREMLADPAVKAAFDANVAADADFAKSPAKRLEFFYRRHPSWDERLDLYPVFRTDDGG